MTVNTQETTWPAARVRSTFQSFFEERGHAIVPSSQVFPLDDPTLLFTNAGMNQFKDVFLGTGSREYKRATNTQKCIRVSGKHNDLEEVGVDTYHHTFFEMLGNWSFGDYFKREAILWAWELLTEVYGLPKERLWVTVFAGDEKNGLAADEEAAGIWREETDIDPSRILFCDRTDNFWEMGETGPCGPCSEIHIDRGGPSTNPSDGADPTIGVNAGNERFIELWNLVFMQFTRQDDGSLKDLPAKHVDTGMGFERITAVLQGRDSNYHTDVFTPIFESISVVTGKQYTGGNSTVDVAFRVCADHMRALCASLSDGATPSNTGRGYVLRRLIRRAARFGSQELGMSEPWLFKVIPAVADGLGDAFPEMLARLEHVQLVIREEEASFGRTLARGIQLFDAVAKEAEATQERELPGRLAFELYATSGFPQDLVEQMARERGLTVDLQGWAEAEAKHKQASKSEGNFKQLLSAEELEAIPSSTKSLFYRHAAAACEETETRVLFARERTNGELAVVLDRTPFFAESGGQVGDSGTLRSGSCEVEVTSTKKVGGVIVHLGKLRQGSVPACGDLADAVVDRERRDRIACNHSATHLLGKALREVLGEHVKQQGSEVNETRLRFDFSNPKGVSASELDQVEARVNVAIRRNDSVVVTEEALDVAKAQGAVAAFGEKYSSRVRVVDMGGWSMELCGGTHVSATGNIGTLAIISERAVSAGVRRIEAVTGALALGFFQNQRRVLREAARSLKANPDELVARLGLLQKQLKEAKKQRKAASGASTAQLFEGLKKASIEKHGILHVIADLGETGGADLRELAGQAKQLGPDLVLALFGREGSAVPFVVVCAGQALDNGFKAGDLAKTIAGHIGGGGGGRPNQAQGKGLDAGALAGAIAELSAL